MSSGAMGMGRVVLAAIVVVSLASSHSGAAAPRRAALGQPMGLNIPNLQAYYPLDTDGSDISGNGNNGTLGGGTVMAAIDPADKPAVPAGNVASCNFPTLTGGSRIDAPDSASLSVTGSLSVTAWVKTNLTFPSVDLQEIVGKFGGATKGGYFVRVNTGGGIWIALEDAAGTLTGGSGTNKTLTTGAWNHVAATFDTTTGMTHFYIDGVQSSDTFLGVAPADGTAGLIIGLNSGNEFNGHIDEVRIYARTLTPGEIGTLVSGTQAAPGGPLNATPGVGQIALTWSAAANATSYNVYRDDGLGGPIAFLTNVPGTNFTDTTVSNPNSYNYEVTAAGALESTPLGPVSAVPLAGGSPPPVSTGTRHESNNLAHRCGCSSIGDGAASMLGLAALAVLLVLVRKK